MPINTTAVYSSNYLPCDNPKVFNRLLPIYFPENGIDTTFIDDKFVNDERRSIIIAELLKYPKENIISKIQEVENWLLESKFLKDKDRESNNIAIAYTGLLLLEMISSYKFLDKEARLKDYCDWYINLSIKGCTPVERFIKALPTLVNSSKMKKDIHFVAEIKNNRFLFTFDFANSLILYNQEFAKDDPSKYIDKRMFGADLKNSKYFVTRKNHRFNNSKGQGYSYTLDLTSHEVVPYLQVWAQTL